jgi:hypothetical protein
MFNHLRVARGLCVAGVMFTLGGASLGILGSTAHAANEVNPATGTVSVHNTPYSTLGQGCDSSNDGFHFILNGLAYAEGATINADDFGTVKITFSSGAPIYASFTGLSGGKTAHFINSSANQTGNYTITSATMTWPAGSDIISFGQFTISHVPCGTVGSTTTTVEETTTTVADECDEYSDEYDDCDEETTTTVAEEETTTTVADEETTTTVADEETTTTLAITGVSTPPQVASAVITPVVVTPVVAAAAPATALPVTGNNAGKTAMLGMFLLTAGLTLWGLARRPRALMS